MLRGSVRQILTEQVGARFVFLNMWARSATLNAEEANMNFKTLRYGAAIAGLAAALSVAGVTAGSAAPHWHGGHGGWGPGPAIGAGVAGFALGAAAASSAPYYGYDGYYDYAPGPVVVDPGPGYYDYYDAPGYPYRRQGQCHFSIRGC